MTRRGQGWIYGTDRRGDYLPSVFRRLYLAPDGREVQQRKTKVGYEDSREYDKKMSKRKMRTS
ncbi:MAG: hypothetical protein WBZ36_11570 [Candidatus Nitrosopolaris sp.]